MKHEYKKMQDKIEAGLYLVATPIGNLEDITLRALRILNCVDKIYCEDTRVTKKLLNYYQIEKKLYKYNDYSNEDDREIILQDIINGLSVAILSDAGTPLISDPGYKLVRALRDKDINITSIPGPSALTSSAVVSGLPTDKIYFIGFLPNNMTKRKIELEKVKTLNTTVVIFESSKKLSKTLDEIKNIYGNIDITIVRELTKIFEEVISAKIEEIIKISSENKIRGEIVVLFNTSQFDYIIDYDVVEADIRKLINDLPLKQITNIIHTKHNLPKKKIYDLCLKFKKTIKNIG